MKYRILDVDLSKNKCVKKILPDSFVRQWLGGRGAAAALLKEANVARANVFSEQTAAVIAAGCFCGLLPGADRVWASCFSPLTGFYSSASAPGQFGLALRRSGFDAVRVRGKSDSPVRLFLHEGKAEVLPAKEVWGETVSATLQALGGQHADSRTLCVGPAGENLVKHAALSADGALCLRGGAAAVLGYKKLKAVTVQGDASLPVSEEESGKVRSMATDFFHDPVVSEDVALLEKLNSAGLLACDNWRKPQLEAVGFPEALAAKGLSLNEAWAFTACLGFADADAAAFALQLCGDLGLDFISMGGILAWLKESGEKSLTEQGVKDAGVLSELVSQTAYRHGVGNMLAEGALKASLVVGAASRDVAVHQAGMPLPAYDCRLFPSLLLTYVFGHGDHWKAFTLPAELGLKPRDRLSLKGKARLVSDLFDKTAALDSFGFSPFASIPPELLKRAFGVFYKSKPDVVKAGRNICVLERRLDVARGLTRKDDALPPRVFQELAAAGKKVRIKPADFEALKREFYKLRGSAA